MYNENEVQELVNQFEANLAQDTDPSDTTETFNEALQSGNTDAVRDAITRTNLRMLAALPAGFAGIPKVTLLITPSVYEGETEINTVKVTVRAIHSAPFQFKAQGVFAGADMLDKIKSFFESVYVSLIEKTAENYNVEVINDELAKAVEDAGVPYTVELSLSEPGKGNAIEYISNDSLVLRADRDKIFKTDDIHFASEIDEDDSTYDAFKAGIAKAHENLVNNIRTLATTPEFVAAKPGIVRTFVHVEAFQPKTLIRKSLSSTESYIKRAKKDGIRFRIETESEGTPVMGILERRDGELVESLSAFDEKTMLPVDFDLVAAVTNEEQAA